MMCDLFGRFAFHAIVLAIVGGLYIYADVLRRTGATPGELMQPVPGFSAVMDRANANRDADPADLASPAPSTLPSGKSTPMPLVLIEE